MREERRAGTRIYSSALLKCNAHRYFLERDCAAFRALTARTLRLGSLRFAESWQSDGSTFVRLVTKPELAHWVPASVQNAVKNASEIEFHDVIEYRPSAVQTSPYRLFVRSESPFLGSKLKVTSVLTIEDTQDGMCIQTLEGHVRVKLFGLGGMVERIVRDSVRSTYARLPEVIDAWERFRSEAIERGEPHLLLAGRPPIGEPASEAAISKPMKIEEAKDPSAGCNTADAGAETRESGLASANNEAAAATMRASTQPKRNECLDANGKLGDGKTPYRVTSLANIPSGAALQTFTADDDIPLPGETTQWQQHEPIPWPQSAERPMGPTPSSMDKTTAPPSGVSSYYHHHIQQLHPSYHRRTVSTDSALSDASEPPMDVYQRSPGTRGAGKAWKRFNRDVVAWEAYWWNREGGLFRAVRGLERVKTELVHAVQLILLLVLVVLLRLRILRVSSGRNTERNGTGSTCRGNMLPIEKRKISRKPTCTVGPGIDDDRRANTQSTSDDVVPSTTPFVRPIAAAPIETASKPHGTRLQSRLRRSSTLQQSIKTQSHTNAETNSIVFSNLRHVDVESKTQRPTLNSVGQNLRRRLFKSCFGSCCTETVVAPASLT